MIDPEASPEKVPVIVPEPVLSRIVYVWPAVATNPEPSVRLQVSAAEVDRTGDLQLRVVGTRRCAGGELHVEGRIVRTGVGPEGQIAGVDQAPGRGTIARADSSSRGCDGTDGADSPECRVRDDRHRASRLVPIDEQGTGRDRCGAGVGVRLIDVELPTPVFGHTGGAGNHAAQCQLLSRGVNGDRCRAGQRDRQRNCIQSGALRGVDRSKRNSSRAADRITAAR